MTIATIEEKRLGAFWGLATGDALGAPIEFYPRDRLPEIREMTGGGKFNLPPGAWTDDTSMALCLGHSLIHSPDLDAADLLNRFWNWATKNELCSQDKAFGFGQNTLRTLMKFYKTGQLTADSTGKHSDGNGSIMRLSPVAIVHHTDIEETRRVARRQSFTTHASQKGADCCEFLGMLLHHLFSGLSLSEALIAIENHEATSFWDPIVQDLVRGTWMNKTRPDIASTGYVVHTLEAALWSVYHTTSFEDALILAVNLGHDADTVGAVSGQIAGALYGVQSIPKRWLDTLAKQDLLESCAKGLLNC